MAAKKTVKKVAAKTFYVLNINDDVVGEYPGENADDALRQAAKEGDIEPSDDDEFKVVPKDAVIVLRTNKTDAFQVSRV